MSNILRTYERDIIKGNIAKEKRSVKKGFQQEWANHREKKYIVKDEDGNVIADNTPRNTMRKKKPHFDNVEQYSRMLAYADLMRKEKSEAAETK